MQGNADEMRHAATTVVSVLLCFTRWQRCCMNGLDEYTERGVCLVGSVRGACGFSGHDIFACCYSFASDRTSRDYLGGTGTRTHSRPRNEAGREGARQIKQNGSHADTLYFSQRYGRGQVHSLRCYRRAGLVGTHHACSSSKEHGGNRLSAFLRRVSKGT